MGKPRRNKFRIAIHGSNSIRKTCHLATPGNFDNNFVTNLTNNPISAHTQNLLSKGLKFTASQTKHNHEELLCDLRKFKSKLRYNTILYGNPTRKMHPFKTKSTNEAPKTNNVKLETYLSRIEQDVHSLKNKQDIRQNLTKPEIKTLHELRKNPNVTIKRADKGGSVTIQNTTTYIHEALSQLNDTNNYEVVDSPKIPETNEKITEIITNMKQNNEIDETTYNYLKPTGSERAPRFYTLPKIHKEKRPPPGRPILSGNNSPTEKIAKFLDYFLQPIAKKVNSYIRDSSDFIDKISKIQNITPESLFVTLDVKSLYTNIKHHDGITAIVKALHKHDIELPLKRPPIRRFVQLLNIILKENYFEFGNKYYHQLKGTAMGSKVAPSYAIIFMAYHEEKLLQQTPLNLRPVAWFRFIDDIWSIMNKNLDEVKTFVNHLNRSHDTIQFEAEISKKEIPFLETITYKHTDEKGNTHIHTKPYSKPTDSHMLLHKKSNHPKHCKNNIALGEAIRYRKLSTDIKDFHDNTNKLRTYLHRRGHDKHHVNKQILKAKNRNRKDLLKPKPKKRNGIGPTLVTTYHPNLTHLNNILHKHWHLIENDAMLSQVFDKKPTTCFKKGETINDTLVRAKLPREYADTDRIKPQ